MTDNKRRRAGDWYRGGGRHSTRRSWWRKRLIRTMITYVDVEEQHRSSKSDDSKMKVTTMEEIRVGATATHLYWWMGGADGEEWRQRAEWGEAWGEKPLGGEGGVYIENWFAVWLAGCDSGLGENIWSADRSAVLSQPNRQPPEFSHHKRGSARRRALILKSPQKPHAEVTERWAHSTRPDI